MAAQDDTARHVAEPSLSLPPSFPACLPARPADSPLLLRLRPRPHGPPPPPRAPRVAGGRGGEAAPSKEASSIPSPASPAGGEAPAAEPQLLLLLHAGHWQPGASGGKAAHGRGRKRRLKLRRRLISDGKLHYDGDK
ncbi:Hypothetical predicted protein [Podarcis lilfordi]|uniref:Uncharacterized protein n=1 Tax=Podarcis lilfordi TaxID=74358 RepID=A0AA35KAG8_9SAUR|nr:Hypothetical predicted protein [Podarcis lilfordi]